MNSRSLRSALLRLTLTPERLDINPIAFRIQGLIERGVDIEKMKRVFMNIVTNARDAMPDGGMLTITSRLVGNVVQFEFTDTGCGMSSEL